MDLVVVYLAPIPLGHRVRVVWHHLEQPGRGGGPNHVDTRPHQPWITDLDTGVQYRTDWAVGSDRRRVPDDPYVLGAALTPDHRVERELVGTVTRCIVTTVRGWPALELQTELQIEPDPA